MSKVAAVAVLILSVSLFTGQRSGVGGGRGGGSGGCLVGNVNFGDGTEDTSAPRSIDRTGFVFARLKYHMVPRWKPGTTGISGLGGWGEVPWHHGYSFADTLLPDSMKRLTSVASSGDSYQIVDVDSPEIFKYPFIYMSEPGYLVLNPADAKNLREYFDRGGFMLVDDFRGVRDEYPADNYEYNNMIAQFKKVFPERNIAPLTPDNPIFHIFYDVDAAHMVQSYQTNNSGTPEFLGFSDDKGRLNVVVDYNNDIRQYWQGLDLGRCSLQASSAAVELGVNMVIYAMTH